MATERLYYLDSYLSEFPARVVDRGGDGLRLYLDRTAFYPASGGQPHDAGTIAGVLVVEVIDEGERIAHVTAAPVAAGPVDCRIDWTRRFDHMQQHSGQHLLSAALLEMFGVPTVSFHLGEESSTIDVEAPALAPEQVVALERRANEIVVSNRPITVAFEDAGAARNLRKEVDREGTLRIITIEGLDRSACGGTHVRATGEIGPVLIRKLDKIRGNVRIEFLCGMRAIKRARADFDALARIARELSASPDDTPALVAAQREALEASEKARRKLAAELARARGRELYNATAADASGLRRAIERRSSGALDDELRALAQGFTSQAKAVFTAVVEEPPSVLLAVSGDASIHAGETLKRALAAAGGRGGGNAQMAQGSVPSAAALEAVLAALS